MFSKMLVALMAVCLVRAENPEEYTHWKELLVYRQVVTNQPTAFEGQIEDVDDCLAMAEGYGDSFAAEYIVYYNTRLMLCQLFYRDDLAEEGFNSDDEIAYLEGVTAEREADSEYRMYAKYDKEKDEDGITDIGIVFTIILCIIYGLALTACAFLCEEEDSDISAQLLQLEKKEAGEVDENVPEKKAA